MKCLPFDKCGAFAVHVVAEDRKVDRRQMKSYLVCASRFEVEFHKCGIVIRGDCSIVRDSRVSVIADSASVGKSGMCSDGKCYCAFRFGRDARDECAVGASERMRVTLFFQFALYVD